MTGLSHQTSVSSRVLAIALGLAALASARPALAEEPVETAIKGWVAGIDASPNWVAGFSDLTYDQATKVATIKNLSIRSETLATKVEMTFPTITVAGFGQGTDGGFQASAIKADRVDATIGGFVETHVSGIDIANLTVPSFAAFKWDPNRPATSVVKGYEIVAKSTFDSVTFGSTSATMTNQDQKSAVSYGSFTMLNMKDGKIQKATIASLTEEAPSPNGLLTIKTGKIEALDQDLTAILDVLDPDRYVGGAGDGKWRNVIALETVSDMSIAAPGAAVRAGKFEIENLKVRQPPSSPMPLLDAIFAFQKPGDAEIQRLLRANIVNLLKIWGIGRIQYSDIDMVAPDFSRFHLGDFHINELSSDGLGEIGLGDLDVAAVDKGSFGAERLAVGGILFPPADAIVGAIDAEQSGDQPDPLSLLPTLGYAEAVTVDVSEAGKTLGAVDRARLDLSAFIGPVPTKAAIDVRGLDLDLSKVDDRKARETLEGLGYDRLHADYGMSLAWREVDQSLTISDFKLAIQDLANLTANVVLTGLPRSALEHPDTIETALGSLMFNSATLAVTDKSVVDRAIGMQAKKMKIEPEAFRQQIAGALPLFMMVLKNPGFQAKLAPALQAFIRAPGTFTVTAAPASPVPLPDLIAAADEHPEQLPDLLGVKVDAKPVTK